MIHEFGVAVRIHDGHHRDVQLVRLRDCDVLAPRVDDEQGVGEPFHVPDAVEVADHLLALAVQPQTFLLGQQILLVGELLLRLLKALDRGPDRDEVGQRTAEPAMGDVELAAAPRLFLDRMLRLTLGADEQQPPPHASHVLDVVRRLAEAQKRLLKIDDVDAVTATEDETAHLRIPAPRLMAEVDTRLQHLLHRDLSQETLPATAC